MDEEMLDSLEDLLECLQGISESLKIIATNSTQIAGTLEHFKEVHLDVVAVVKDKI